MSGPLKAFILICVAYLLWSSCAAVAPRLAQHKAAMLHYVNFGIYFCLAQLVFQFILHASGLAIGILLPIVTFSSWTATLVIVLNRLAPSLSSFARRTSLLFIVFAPLIFLAYPGQPNGLRSFFNDVDHFSGLIVRGESSVPGITQQERKHADSGENNSEGSQESAGQEQTAKTSNDTEGEGRVRFRASHLLKATFFFIETFLVANYYGRMWRHRYQDKLKRGEKQTLDASALDQVIVLVSAAVALWTAFVLLGFDTLSVSVFSGLVALGLSVALRDLLGNFASGVLLLMDKSLKMGDVVSIDGSRVGEVSKIGLRYLTIRDRNDIDYLVPYSKLTTGTLENWTKEDRMVRLKLDIGVANDAPIEKVKEIMIAASIDHPRVLKNPLPNPLIMSIDESSIHFQLRFRISDPELGLRNVISDVYERILHRFHEAGIEIPYPQREVRFRTPARPDKSEAETPMVRPASYGETASYSSISRVGKERIASIK